VLGASALTVCASGSCRAAVTVTDGLGRRVSLPSPPRRIVSLIGGAEAQLIALGVRTVGTNIVQRGFVERMWWLLGDTRQPPGVLSADMTPNPEAILALEPDLIIAWAIEHAEFFSRHVPVYVIRHIRTLADLRSNLRALATLVGRGPEGNDVIAAFDRRLLAYTRLAPRSASLSVISQAGNRRFIIYAANTMLTEVLAHVADTVAVAPRSRAGWIEGGIETLHSLDPDAIILIDWSLPPRSDPPAGMRGNRLWHDLRAVRSNKVVTADGFEAVTFQSIPTAARLLDTIAPRLYPDIFPTALDEDRIAAILGG
jgi:iron complex transport system substrate-binding protein